jgi:hypothetical protein
VCAAVVTVCFVGVALAEDIQVIISSVEGETLVYKKTEKGKATGDDIKGKLSKGTKMFKGKAMFADGKLTIEKGDAVEADAARAMITKAAEGKAKGQRAQITTDDKGNITQVILLAGKKGGGKKPKDGK